jgi:toxin ParE1/3/4
MPRRTRRVIWTQVASHDLDEILTFIAADSPLNARKLLARLQRKADSLATMADRGRVVPELAFFGIRTWRELLLKPYRLVYRTSAHAVYVSAVLDGRRDLQDVLLERLIRTG